MVPGSQTSSLIEGRFGIVIDVDDIDGTSVQVDGILDIRPGNVISDVPRTYFQPGIMAVGVTRIPGYTINGVPVDADGFPLLATDYGTWAAPGQTSAILGTCILGQMVLGAS